MDREPPFTIELITTADRNDVIECLVNFFFKHEPIVQYMQLDTQLNLTLNADNAFVQECANYIRENCSFKAVTWTGKIIGITVNGIIRRQVEAAEETNGWKELREFFEYIDTQHNVFDIHKEHDRALEAKFICVDDAYRGLGVCAALAQRTIEYMQAHELSVFVMNCSSFYTAKTCERLDFQLDFTLPYKEYLVEGLSPIIPGEPHDAFRCYSRIVSK